MSAGHCSKSFLDLKVGSKATVKCQSYYSTLDLYQACVSASAQICDSIGVCASAFGTAAR